MPVTFFGRRREREFVKRSLFRGKNVLISGPFGIGKSALLDRVAEALSYRWAFIKADFSRSPFEVCRELLAQVDPKGEHARRAAKSRFPSLRANLLGLLRTAGKPWVVVLDDVAALTPPRLNLLERLVATRSCRFVVAVDPALPAGGFERLRGLLYPAGELRLGHLDRRAREEFFLAAARYHGVEIADAEADLLARTTRGYPLLMVERCERLRRRSLAARSDGLESAPARITVRGRRGSV